MNKWITLIMVLVAATLHAQPGKKILEMPGVQNAYPRWSKDGKKILFQSNRNGKWQIYTMNRDGSNERRITTDSFNNNFVDWSPDNKKIVYVSDKTGNEDIYIMNTDGSDAKNITNNPARDIHPYFSPDGKKILFNSTRDATAFEIYEMDIDGTHLQRLTHTVDEETCARFSPDMKKIVYLVGVEAIHNDEVYMMNSDGSGITDLSQSVDAEGWPVWEQTGNRIVYSASPDGRTFSLFELDIATKQRKAITTPERGFGHTRPNLNPADNKEIVFNRQDGKGTIGIYILHI